MSIKLVSATVRLWTYRAQGIIPAGTMTKPGDVERLVRSAVSWADGMLAHIKGTEVLEEELRAEDVDKLLADFRRRLEGPLPGSRV